MLKADLEEMTFNTVFSLIKRYGDTSQHPELDQIKGMLESHGFNSARVTINSWIYKFCALMWEQSYQVIMKS